MNESSAYLWKKAQEQESFTAEDLAQWLTEEYDIDKETALADSKTVSEQWIKAGICEE